MKFFKKKNLKPKTCKLKTNEGGYSLIELLTAITLFVIIMGLNTNLFVNAVRGQKKAIAVQNVTDNARYLMELMSKEIRVADVNSFVLVGTDDLSFVSGSENRLGQTLRFALVGDSVVFDDDTTVADAQPITPSSNINITHLEFILTNVGSQTRVTIVLKAESKNTNIATADSITLQTTISPREINI